MDFITALILGIVQGISEFLPISSTGHLILASHLMGLKHTEFLKSFEIAIQAGTILSVVVLYWRSLLVDFEVIKRLAVAFLPTGLLGLTLYRLIKGYLLGSETVVLCSLLIGGILIIAFERWYREGENATGDIRAMSYKNAMADLDLGIDSPEQREALITRLSKDLRIGSAQRTNLFTLSYDDTRPERAQRVVQSLLSLFVVPVFYAVLAKYTRSPDAVAHELEKLEASTPDAGGHA